LIFVYRSSIVLPANCKKGNAWRQKINNLEVKTDEDSRKSCTHYRGFPWHWQSDRYNDIGFRVVISAM
jgi:hypothetical protein